jgi:hypothetical protein
VIYSYGKEQKKIIFASLDKTHAELIIRLRYDGLTQGNFFRFLVSLYLKNDPRVLSIVEDLKEEKGKFGRAKNKKTSSIHQERVSNEKLYGLTKAEKEEIFDMIEKIGDL